MKKRFIALCTAAVFLYCVCMSTASSGVLLGTGTLNNANDLTRIQVGSTILEFLDLSATNGLSVATAVATYGSSGFFWATDTEVSELYDAFGFAYAASPGTVANLVGTTPAEEAEFVSYFGVTLTVFEGTASLGWLDDLTTQTLHTYACVGLACSPDSFTINTSLFWPAQVSIGVYLVRVTQAQVPEPATLALLGIGLAGLAFSRRRLRFGRRWEAK